MTSIGDRWDRANGRPAGFDALRISLSVAVILWHTVSACYGDAAEQPFYHGPLRPLIWFVVPAFFALSGFLVAGSLERNNVRAFVTLRVIRIFPALSAEVLICALLIGPLFTHFALRQYFTDPEFFRYFLNTIGDIHYSLPGVFTTLPDTGVVNTQLWTVPHELECYVAITAAALIGLTRRRRLFLAAVMVIVAASGLRDYFSGAAPAIAAPPGRMLVLAFLCGVALYLNRAWLAYSHVMFFVCAAGFVASVLASTRLGEDLASIFIAYVTVYLGMLSFPVGLLTKAADYSYGVYLYGYPVQQSVSELFPDYRVWYINFGLSLPIVFVLAFVSWHLLESRVLRKKKTILGWVSRLSSRSVPRWPWTKAAADTLTVTSETKEQTQQAVRQPT